MERVWALGIKKGDLLSQSPSWGITHPSDNHDIKNLRYVKTMYSIFVMELDQDTINDILEMLAQLTPREEQILKMIYGLVEKKI